MLIRHLYFIISLLAITNYAFAQITKSPAVEFGKVSLEELATQKYAIDSNAVAVILYEKGISYYASESSVLKLVHERHVRIKILSEKAASWAKFEIPTFKSRGSDQKEVLETLEGYTHLLKDGKVVRHKLEAQDVFKITPMENLDVTRFVMPYCEVGAVVEYHYKMTSDYIFNLQGWEFQKSIPTLWSEYEIKIPEYFSYFQLVQGYEEFSLQSKNEGADYFAFNGMLNTADVSTYKWAIKELPAFVPLPFMENPAHNIPRVDFSLDSFKFPFMSERETNPSTWETIYKALKKDDRLYGFVKKTGGLKEIVQNITANKTTETDKMKSLYQYVKKNVKWNGEFSRQASLKNPEKVLEVKKGNSADINLLLVALARQAGLPANPLVLSSKETGVFNPKLPIFQRMNIAIAAVVADGILYKLDATQAFATPEILPLRCFNGGGILVADTMQIMRLVPEVESRKIIQGNFTFPNFNLDNNTNQSLDILGQVNIEEKGYIALNSREIIASQSKENFIQQSLLTANKGVGVDKIMISNDSLVDENLKSTVDVTAFRSANFVATNGNTPAKITFRPLLFLGETENPFGEKSRKYPVDFVFPFIEDYTVTFTIPDGYTIESLPKPEEFASINGEILCRFQVSQAYKQVTIKHLLSISTLRTMPKNYGELREFWDRLVKKHLEQVVLVRKK